VYSKRLACIVVLLLSWTGLVIAPATVGAATTRWRVQPTPSPVGRGAFFDGVSCGSTTNCVAVGYSQGSGGDFDLRRLLERWNGTSWSVEVTPSAFSTMVFNAVSCPTAQFCAVVGANENGPSIDMWNGHAWSERPVAFGSTLLGVSCVSAASCVAVGEGTRSQSLILRWNGAKWSGVTPPAHGATQLNAVTCVSAANCFAVGDGTGSSVALVDHWNGASWSVQDIQAPAGYMYGANLGGVACLSARSCYLVGYSPATSGDRRLAEHWNGRAWTISVTPGPAGDTLFNAASCRSGQCVFVGSTGALPFVVRSNGSQFTDESVQVPPGGATLYGVACPTATNCFAVGGTGQSVTLAEHSD
jgi:hypothetical protein